MKLLKYIKATALCIRFPFLYPRNRFTGLHYNNWKIANFHRKWWKCTEDIFYFQLTQVQASLSSVAAINNRMYAIIKAGEYIVVSSEHDVVLKIPVSHFGTGDIINCGFLDKTPTIVIGENFKEDTNSKRLFVFVHAKWLQRIIKFFDWINAWPLQLFHCFTDYTELDAMPSGWRKAFGIKMCKEIKAALLKEGGLKALYSYRIMDIKEKFGTLRWDDCHTTETIQHIINKYEGISYNTCIICGKQATWISNGWISPYCDEHIRDRNWATPIGETKIIEEYAKG